MKDASIVFPIYNLVGAQLKGGVIEQDDQCSLESDLAEKYVQEAQTQVSNVHIRTLSYHIPSYTYLLPTKLSGISLCKSTGLSSRIQRQNWLT